MTEELPFSFVEDGRLVVFEGRVLRTFEPEKEREREEVSGK
jgi:hypothetical protein